MGTCTLDRPQGHGQNPKGTAPTCRCRLDGTVAGAAARLVALVGLMFVVFMAKAPATETPAAGTPQAQAGKPADGAHHDWIFDRGLYTNDPKTGQRVWQYQPDKPAYRDPYSFFDSPHTSFPFTQNAFYDLYPYNQGLYPYFFIPAPGAPVPVPFAPPPGYGPPPYDW